MKKRFIVFETERPFAEKVENQKDVWKSEVPYKNFVRIIIAPFEISTKESDTEWYHVRQQLAVFIIKNHLKIFEKMKLHRRNYSFEYLDYTDKEYKRFTQDCSDCKNQYEKIIINGFQYNPNTNPAKIQTNTKETQQLNALFSGK